MAYTNLKKLIKLEDAIVKCKKKAFLWHADGLAIKYDGKIPTDSIVARTSVLVDNRRSGLIMLICICVATKTATVVAAENFSSLEELKINHPSLYNKLGTLDIL